MAKMMRRLCILLAFGLVLGSFAGCGGDPYAAGKTSVVLWGFAEAEEAESMEEMKNWYNQYGTDGIYIDYYPQPAGSYVTLAERALASRKGPDVFYVGDRYLKRWAKRGHLVDLSAMAEEENIDMSDWWASSQYRWRYDTKRNTNNPDDPLYALPKDIDSSALYYNASVMERQGIAVISVDAEDLDTFNAGEADRNGKTKSQLGLDGFTVPAKGFYREQTYKNGHFTQPMYGVDGKVVETMVFNNRIAMSWDEIEDLAMILTKSYNASLTAADTTWGYYTEWWFNYGWGVGGDCAVDPTGEGDWTFTLGDKTRKRLLYDAEGNYAVDAYGKEIFVEVGKEDEYPIEEGQYLGEPLPSQYEAFERFVKLGKPAVYGGLGVAPRVSGDIGLSSSSSFFSSGKVAMLVETSDKTSTFAKGIRSFEWDVAPLPVYKTYEADGVTVRNKGLEIGHSGSTGVAVWSNSKVQKEAFKVALYFATGNAQKMQAQNGYRIPNSKTLAETDYVKYNLEKGAPPKNIEAFTRAAENARPGDWWYMPDNLWIDNWATPLNTQYRENDKSLDEFFAAFTSSTNDILKSYKEQGLV